MAIVRPGAGADAPACGPQRSGGRGWETFLAREKCAHAQGKKVAPAPLRPRRPRRQPSLGQIRPSEAAWQRDAGRTTETAGDCRHARHKHDEPGIAVSAPMACTREDPAGTGKARCRPGDP